MKRLKCKLCEGQQSMIGKDGVCYRCKRRYRDDAIKREKSRYIPYCKIDKRLHFLTIKNKILCHKLQRRVNYTTIPKDVTCQTCLKKLGDIRC